MRAKLAYLNLKRVDDIINRKTEIAKSYLTDDLLNETASFPAVPKHAKAAFIKMPFRPKRLNRALLYEKCREQGVDLEYLFPYSYGEDQSNFPRSRTAAKNAMVLPTYSALDDKTSCQTKVL